MQQMVDTHLTVKGKPFRIDGIVKGNLDAIKKVIKNDWDFVYIVDGKEGSGKSVFAQQLAYYLTDGNLELDDIVFNVEDFKHKLRTQEKYRAVIWDEAYVGINSSSSLAAINKEVTRLLMECRQRNLYIFIVMPTFWDLSKYAKLHRANGLWHVHVGKGMERGFFRYYPNGALKTMERQTSKYKYDHPIKYRSFYGRFTKGYVVDEEEYRAKKDRSFKSEIEESREKDTGMTKLDWKTHFLSFILYIHDKKGFTFEEIGEKSGLNPATIRTSVRSFRQKGLDNVKDVGKFPPQQGDTTI